MEALKRYRRKMNENGSPDKSAATDPFIEMALNKIQIHKRVSGDTLSDMFDAVLIFRDKEGPDTGILYTYATDGLQAGDSFVKKGIREENDVHYLIIEEVKRVDTSVVIRVFNVLETNVIYTSRENRKGLPAYLISNLRNNIKTDSRRGVIMEIKSATMVAPKSYRVRLNDKLNIKNLMTNEESYSSWIVDGIDDVSTAHINYLHLTQTLKEDFKDPEVIPLNTVEPYDSIELETLGGFVKTAPKATILDRTATKVVVQVPAGTKTLVITVKNKSGVEEPHTYTIGGS